MGPLVFPKDRVVSCFGAETSPDASRKRLWSGLNLLVIGPPGCGKVSLISVLSRAFDPSLQQTLFDLETERETQDLTLDHFAAQFRRYRTRSAKSRAEGLIFRHLHRLSADQLGRLLRICTEDAGWSDDSVVTPPPTLYATCYENQSWDRGLREEIEKVFPCQVHLTGLSAMKKDVGRFVLDVVSELNDRHGKRITEVESGVLDAVQRRAAWRTSLHELRSVIERAYFREDSERLSIRSIEAV